MKTATQMTIESLKTKWIGRMVMSSTDHGLDASSPKDRAVTKIWQDTETGKYFAWADEHHSANSVEALDRRLESLVRRAKA
jgi:hypothetical protein